jgi:hypothetical protein
MKRIISVSVALFAAFVFLGCGSGSSDTTPPIPPVTSEVESPPMPEPM